MVGRSMVWVGACLDGGCMMGGCCGIGGRLLSGKLVMGGCGGWLGACSGGAWLEGARCRVGKRYAQTLEHTSLGTSSSSSVQVRNAFMNLYARKARRLQFVSFPSSGERLTKISNPGTYCADPCPELASCQKPSLLLETTFPIYNVCPPKDEAWAGDKTHDSQSP